MLNQRDDTYIYELLDVKRVAPKLIADRIGYLDSWALIHQLESFQATAMEDTGYDADYAGKMIALYKAIARDILSYLQRF